MLGVVAPVSHKKEYPGVPPVGVAVKVAEPPTQTCVGFTLTLQAGVGFTNNIPEQLVVQPFASTIDAV